MDRPLIAYVVTALMLVAALAAICLKVYFAQDWSFQRQVRRAQAGRARESAEGEG